jgi:DNA-binding MarR family transcriptional regulator
MGDPELPALNDVRLAPLDDAVGYWLRRAQLAVFDDFARRFQALKLTPAQFSTLIAIRDNPGRRQSEIAEALGVRRPNFVAMLDELERRCLAERTPSGADRRANALRLTPAGETLLARGLLAQSEQEASICARIGETERERLLETLRRLAGLE